MPVIAVERLRDSITNLSGKKIWELNFRLQFMGAHSAQCWNCLTLIFNLTMTWRLDAVEAVYRVVFECLRMFVNNKKFSKEYGFRKSSLTSELCCCL